MWKFPPFVNFVRHISLHPLIREIIIINNSVLDTPESLNITNTKIQLIDFSRNIYVNPSWNVGVAHSHADTICIANDDILFDLRIFDKLNQFEDDWGAVGLSTTSAVAGDICFEKWQGQNMAGFGQLFFVKRKNWLDIPYELQVYSGDAFVWDVMQSQTHSLWLIKNLMHYTEVSTTSRDFTMWDLYDNRLYNQTILKEYNMHRTYCL